MRQSENFNEAEFLNCQTTLFKIQRFYKPLIKYQMAINSLITSQRLVGLPSNETLYNFLDLL